MNFGGGGVDLGLKYLYIGIYIFRFIQYTIFITVKSYSKL